MTVRTAAALVFSATLMLPAAAAAKTGSIFDITRAGGFERVTFTGDSAASCESFGTCGYSGTVTYSVGGKPRGTLILARSRSGRVTGGATYRTHGITRASVLPPAGAPECTDTVSHKTDLFTVASLPNSIKTLLVSYAGAGEDILATNCAGPTKKDVAAAGALPEGTFKASGFTGKRLRFGFSGGAPFMRNGYSVNSEWDLRFKAAGRSCNPRCPLPAHRPR
ncbi:MAG: hypothetical protein QOC95_2679 [Thermoleophilaceae bacterium]|jgi:hypothetical protein|nr:hypothetical protein [Thermoleophilaceae bacterium]